MQHTAFRNDETIIRNVMNEVLLAFNAGDVEKAVSLHTENVVLMESNMPAISGKKTLKNLFDEYFIRKKSEKTKLQLSFDILELEIMGSRAFTRGNVVLTTFKEDAEPVQTRGKFLCLFQKQPDGGWLRSHIVSNNDSPPVSA